MRQRGRRSGPPFAALGQVDLDEIAILALEAAEGCRALTTPAPWVQRLPAPPAKASTATSPPANAASPARSVGRLQTLRRCESSTSPSATSSMTVLGGRRFWARPIRPVRRSERICSCSSGSKPFASRIDFRLASGRRLLGSAWGTGPPAASRWNRPAGHACGTRRQTARSRRGPPGSAAGPRAAATAAHRSHSSAAGISASPPS